MDNEKALSNQFYPSFVNVRNTELTVHWTRYNILAAVNLALLAVALSAEPFSLIRQFPIWIMIGGIVLAVIWLLITIKGKQLFTKRWEKHIRNYERRFDDQCIQLFTKVKKEEKEKIWLKRNWDNINFFAWSLPVICMVAWIIIGCYFQNAKSENIRANESDPIIVKLVYDTNRHFIEIQGLKRQIKGLESKVLNLSNLRREDMRGSDLGKQTNSMHSNNDVSKMYKK